MGAEGSVFRGWELKVGSALEGLGPRGGSVLGNLAGERGRCEGESRERSESEARFRSRGGSVLSSFRFPCLWLWSYYFRFLGLAS